MTTLLPTIQLTLCSCCCAFAAVMDCTTQELLMKINPFKIATESSLAHYANLYSPHRLGG